jgi:hypothetical protein
VTASRVGTAFTIANTAHVFNQRTTGASKPLTCVFCYFWSAGPGFQSSTVDTSRPEPRREDALAPKQDRFSRRPVAAATVPISELLVASSHVSDVRSLGRWWPRWAVSADPGGGQQGQRGAGVVGLQGPHRVDDQHDRATLTRHQRLGLSAVSASLIAIDF